MNRNQLEKFRRLLCELQDAIRDALVAAQSRAQDFTRVAAITSADTIYAVDRISEQAICDWFERRWPSSWPVELVMEGIEADCPHTFPRGTPVAKTRLKCILDPIDGTRGYMYDKRAAWSLAALAPQRGSATRLTDVCVAAMTELPTHKQWRADQLSAVRGAGLEGVQAWRKDIRSGGSTAFRLRPSQAADFRHGFASFARYFPDSKATTTELEEEFWSILHCGETTAPLVFEDQYICTGGQLAEIALGHDRFVADLRGLACNRTGARRALPCHPYDVCTALVAQEAGAIVEAPDGSPLDAPLDTTTPVAWVAYANPQLAALARPVLSRILAARLGS